MPTDKDFKRLIRQRMTDTGQRFTEARAALSKASVPPHRKTRLDTSENGERWIELLGDPNQNQGAFRLLNELPPDELRRLAVAGTRNESAKVRRRSCQLLDNLVLEPESIDALEVCAADPDPRVRGAALHTLACERCKPDGACLDQRMVAERAAMDPSAKVRRGVAMGLSWNPKHSDEWSVALATRFLADPSAEIRRYARAALERIERQRQTDGERRNLAEPLRKKTERHVGKWVAIADGGIVAVEPSSTWQRRRPDARLYFVTPGAE